MVVVYYALQLKAMSVLISFLVFLDFTSSLEWPLGAPVYSLENSLANQCSREIVVTEAMIHSHQHLLYQALYEHNTNCYMTFRAATPGWRLRLVSQEFNIPINRKESHCNDVLYVYDSKELNPKQQMRDPQKDTAGFCGKDKKRKALPPITSTGSYLTLQFKTDAVGERGRFVLYIYQFADDEHKCYGHFPCHSDIVGCVDWNVTCNRLTNCPDGSDDMNKGLSQCSLPLAERVRPPTTPLVTTTTTPVTTTTTAPATTTTAPATSEVPKNTIKAFRSRSSDNISGPATAGIVGGSVIGVFFGVGCLMYVLKKRMRKQKGLSMANPSKTAAARLAQRPVLPTTKDTVDPPAAYTETVYNFSEPSAMCSSHYLPRPQHTYSHHPGGSSRSGRRSHPDCMMYWYPARNSVHRPIALPVQAQEWSTPTEFQSGRSSGYASHQRPMHTRPIPTCAMSISSEDTYSSCSYLSHKRHPTPVNL